MAVEGTPEADDGDSDRGFQERIYDERFGHSNYDRRSKVRVLTAEWEALCGAVVRAERDLPPGPLALLDFGYGTGRVTNELVLAHPRLTAGGRHYTLERDLLVVAYDVSAVGLRKGAAALRAEGFVEREAFGTGRGTVLGDLSRERGGRTVTVRFVHARELAEPAQSGDLLREAARTTTEAPYGVTVSWYSALGHVQHAPVRERMFEVLGRLTHPRGELVLSVSTLGDLVEAQKEWTERLVEPGADGVPAGVTIEVAGDVIYETELGQRNYYHVFGPELVSLMRHTCTGFGQKVRLTGIREPDEEFDSRSDELANYRRVRRRNRRSRRYGWESGDYEGLHTIAAVRHYADVGPEDPDARLVGISLPQLLPYDLKRGRRPGAGLLPGQRRPRRLLDR